MARVLGLRSKGSGSKHWLCGVPALSMSPSYLQNNQYFLSKEDVLLTENDIICSPWGFATR